jgi:hypothetical protein
MSTLVTLFRTTAALLCCLCIAGAASADSASLQDRVGKRNF